ncbi:MAG: hypothetical protein C0503_06425 [Gemmatimonas sp.]|nr:hypothetical protein [Gemmatimonas sp.]
MMAGMHGMGHGTGSMPSAAHDQSALEPSVTTRVAGGGLILSVVITARSPGDSVVVVATVVRSDSARARDLHLSLSIAPVAGSAHAAGHEPAATPPEDGAATRVLTPVQVTPGSFVFRFAVPPAAPSRLTVSLQDDAHGGENAALLVEQVLERPMDRAMGGASMEGERHAGLTAALLLGTGVMAAMMLFAFR